MTTALATQFTSIRLPQQWEWDIMAQYANAAVQSGLVTNIDKAKALFIVLKGWELNVTPMEALAHIHIVNGKPGLSAQLMISLANRSGMLARFEMPDAAQAANDKKATVTAVRRDRADVYSMTFTLDDAQAAGLTNKPIWKQYLGQMLINRAVSMTLRRAIPEALSGMYLAEELSDSVPETVIEAVQTQPQIPANTAQTNGTIQATTSETTEDERPTWWGAAYKKYTEAHGMAKEAAYREKAKALFNAGKAPNTMPVATVVTTVMQAMQADEDAQLLQEGDGMPPTWAPVVKAIARHTDNNTEEAKAFIRLQIMAGAVTVKMPPDTAKTKLIGIMAKMAQADDFSEPEPTPEPEPAVVAEDPSDPFADLGLRKAAE